MTESNQRLRVAIVGAGIGGLTLSSALGILGRGQDLELDIWEIMKALGMDEELARMLPEHLITYPLHNRTVNVCEQKEVLDTFVGWEPEVQALMGFKCITKPTKWALRSLVPLERYARGRVLIAGDAAHAMTPHQGAGAGQAVEDAYIIASLLSHKSCTAAAVPTVAEIYNDIRLPTGNRVLQDARNVGRLTQLVAPGFEDVMEGDTTVPLEKLQELFGQVDKKWEWVWKQSAEDDRMKALNMLESSDTSRAVVPPL